MTVEVRVCLRAQRRVTSEQALKKRLQVDGVGGPHCPALWEPPPTPDQGQTEAMEYPSAFSGEGW